MPGIFLAARPLDWDEIPNEDDDDENWAAPGAPSGGRSYPGDGNGNDHDAGEEDMQGGGKGAGQGKGTTDGKGKAKVTQDGKVKGNGNGKGKGLVEHTPGGKSSQSGGTATGSKGNGQPKRRIWDDINGAMALQLQEKMNEEDLDAEG